MDNECLQKILLNQNLFSEIPNALKQNKEERK